MAPILLLLKQVRVRPESNHEGFAENTLELLLWPLHEDARLMWMRRVERHRADRSGDGIRLVTRCRTKRRAGTGGEGLPCRDRWMASSEQQKRHKGASQQDYHQRCSNHAQRSRPGRVVAKRKPGGMNDPAQVLFIKRSLERFSLRARRGDTQTGLGKLLANCPQVVFILQTRIIHLLQVLDEWLVFALFRSKIVIGWHTYSPF